MYAMEYNDTLIPNPSFYRYEVKMVGWNAPEDFSVYIDDYWKSFEAPNPMMHHLLGVLYIFIALVGVLGNGAVIFIFSTTKALRSPSNILILHLAAFDMLMMSKTPIFIYQSFMEGPVLGRLGCKIYGLMGGISGSMNALLNAAIAFDRYKAITNPMEGKLTMKQVLGIIFFMYFWIFPWQYFPITETWNRFVPEGYLTSCTVDYISENGHFFVTGYWFCMWLCPLLIIIVCYYQVYSHVNFHEKKLKEQAEKMNVDSLRSGDKQKMRQEIRVAKVGGTLTTLFLFSWTPYVTVVFIMCFGRKEMITPLVSMIPACTCKLAATIDPFVYAINHPRYRIELAKRMPWFCIHEENSVTETKSVETKG